MELSKSDAALELLAFCRDFIAAPLKNVLMGFPLLPRTILETIAY